MHYPTNPTMENLNTRQYLDSVKQQIFEHLRMLQGAPSVGMEQVPSMLEPQVVKEEDVDADARPADPDDNIGDAEAVQ